MSDLILHTPKSFWGAITIVICALGLITTLFRSYFFYNKKKEMEKRLGRVFLTDASLYLVTLLFGLATFYEIDYDNALYPLRAIFLLLNIWVGILLTSRIKN